MKILAMTVILSLTSILLTNCSKDIYISTSCPYVEPLDLNLTTNKTGGLDALEAYKAIIALRYYGKNTREIKAFVSKRHGFDTPPHE